MESDAEYKALTTIISNDRRQRLFLRLLALVAFIVVLAFLQYIDTHIKSQVKGVLDQQTQLVLDSQRSGRIRTEENRRYITCLLILPQAQRDVASQKFCYDKSDLPGGRTDAEFVPIEFDLNDVAIAALQGGFEGQNSESSSSAESAPRSAAVQSDSSQSAPSAPSPQVQDAPSNNALQPVADITGGLLNRLTHLGGI